LAQVVHLKGRDEGVGGSGREGELCTAVLLNGKGVGYLNDHVRRSSRVPPGVRLALPRESPRAGENGLELRQLPDGQAGRYEGGGMSGGGGEAGTRAGARRGGGRGGRPESTPRWCACVGGTSRGGTRAAGRGGSRAGCRSARASALAPSRRDGRGSAARPR